MRHPLGIGDANSYCTNKFTDWKIARQRGCEFGILRATTTGPCVNGKISIIMDASYPMNVERMGLAGD
jgi:hypothetical protein